VNRELLPRVGFVVVWLLLVAGLAGSLERPGQAQRLGEGEGFTSAPPVYPTPQSVRSRPDGFPITPVVGLVTGSRTDPAAIEEVRAALKSAGAKRIVGAPGGGGVPSAPLTVWVGGPEENPASAEALEALGVEGPAGLGPEGYVLAAGRDSEDRARIVLAGKDPDGTFYAAQTLRQLVVQRRGADWMPGVEVRDWPAMKLRGVIEGFYGTPWTHEQRLRQMEFYGDVKMNVYAYAPKDDPYHRERWDEPYPPEKLAEIEELVERAKANHVDFIFAISPGLSICYSSDEDFQRLLDKFEAVYDIGVRHFNVALDDIDYTEWHCPEDPARFGTGPAGAGRAQSHLLNRVVGEFVETHEGVERLQMVPTEYYNTSDSPYKRVLREELDPSVIVEWTGVGVVPPRITKEQAEEAVEVFGHDVLVWDNYPVNDYAAGQLLLGPFNGREAGLSGVLYGLHANPMNQAEASKIPLFTVADYVWNDADYEPQRSLEASLDHLAGGDKPLVRALARFVDVNYASILNPENAPRLAPKIEAFWEEYEAGRDGRATAELEDALAELAKAPKVIRGRLDNPIFLEETRVWLDATELWAGAASSAVDMLQAQAADDGEKAWRARREAVGATEEARALRDDTVPHNQAAPKVGTGVIDVFVEEALERNEEWLGATGDRPEPTTTLGTYQDYTPERMVDGDPGTFYWSSGPPGPGDSVGVDLGEVREIQKIEILMAKDSSPNDYIHEGVLEISEDGESWTALGTFTGRPEISVSPPEGTQARYIRLRATAAQEWWVVVREFAVETPGDIETSVSGGPPAEQGSSLENAIDGNPDTAYEAARAPLPGEALSVELSAPQDTGALVVLQNPDSPAKASVQVRSEDGGWSTVGDLDGGYTRLDVGRAITGVRLAWSSGTATPEINEVILRRLAPET